MNEPFIIKTSGTTCLISVSCEAEARYIAKKTKGIIRNYSDIEGFKIRKMLNELQKQ